LAETSGQPERLLERGQPWSPGGPASGRVRRLDEKGELDMDESGIVTGSLTASASGTPDGAASAEEHWAGFDRWSSNLFLLIAVLTFVVLLAVGGLAGESGVPTNVVLTTLALALVQVVLLVTASIGLDRHWAWARTTARWILWIMIVTGVGGALIDLLQPRLTIPLGAIAAIVVLRRQPGSISSIAGRNWWIAIGIGAVFLAATIAMAGAAWVTRG
jgi:hypothetical protein